MIRIDVNNLGNICASSETIKVKKGRSETLIFSFEKMPEMLNQVEWTDDFGHSYTRLVNPRDEVHLMLNTTCSISLSFQIIHPLTGNIVFKSDHIRLSIQHECECNSDLKQPSAEKLYELCRNLSEGLSAESANRLESCKTLQSYFDTKLHSCITSLSEQISSIRSDLNDLKTLGRTIAIAELSDNKLSFSYLSELMRVSEYSYEIRNGENVIAKWQINDDIPNLVVNEVEITTNSRLFILSEDIVVAESDIYVYSQENHEDIEFRIHLN